MLSDSDIADFIKLDLTEDKRAGTQILHSMGKKKLSLPAQPTEVIRNQF